ncbi:MAG: cyclase family protein [Rhizobiaceae bacterium]|nr:cyclase family protein [Rhizobiaceae bacterium]
MKRWTVRPEGSNWGDFGPDDEVGRLNLLTPVRVAQAASEIREGLNFCLSLPLDYPGGQTLNPRRSPPRMGAVERGGMPAINYPMRRDDPLATDVLSDDNVHITLQYSTQWDGLSHYGQTFDVHGNGRTVDVYYNGFRAVEDVVGPMVYGDGEPVASQEPQGARRLGIEKMAETCVQGRGVMIDLFAHCGPNREHVGYDRLMRILEADKIEIEIGDMICLRTGFSKLLMEMNRKPDPNRLFAESSALDGTDPKLLNWITDTGIVALASDNFAVEGMPDNIRHGKPREREDAKPSPTLPLHAHCLFKLGVYLGELWYLDPLADWLRNNGRSRFFLTAPPLRLPGAVGSPVTPVATV